MSHILGSSGVCVFRRPGQLDNDLLYIALYNAQALIKEGKGVLDRSRDDLNWKMPFTKVLELDWIF